MKPAPTVVEAVVALLITGVSSVAGAMVMVRIALPVPPALVAEMVTGVVPEVVGVPLMTPVVVASDNPAGRPTPVKKVAALLAEMV